MSHSVSIHQIGYRELKTDQRRQLAEQSEVPRGKNACSNSKDESLNQEKTG